MRATAGGKASASGASAGGIGHSAAARAVHGQGQPAASQAPEVQQSPSPWRWSPAGGIGIAGVASAIAAWWQGGTDASAAASCTAASAIAGIAMRTPATALPIPFRTSSKDSSRRKARPVRRMGLLYCAGDRGR